MTLPGIEVRPLVTLNGDTDFAEIFFHDVQVRLEELVDDFAAADDGSAHGVLQDPVTLRRLGESAVRIKYLEVLCQRSISATLHGGSDLAAFGSASLAKTVWGEIGQDLAALAFDVLGTRGRNAPWANYRLTSRSLTIAGGTTQINKNITSQRVLGLPRK